MKWITQYKGLQILVMFHLDVFRIPKSTLENILKKFMSIIIEDFIIEETTAIIIEKLS